MLGDKIDAGAVSPLVSSDDDEAVAQNKKKTFGERCKSSRFLSATWSTVGELSCLFVFLSPSIFCLSFLSSIFMYADYFL